MKRATALLIILSSFLLVSCAKSPKKSEEHFPAMDTYITVEAYGENSDKAVREVRSRVEYLEKLWSATDENSEIYALNHGKDPELSKETLDLAKYSLEMSEKTDGAFDPTIYPVLTAWGFTTENYRIPDSGELSELLGNVGYKNVVVDGEKIVLKRGMMLDFGGSAKGAASDYCAEIMRENGIKSALINLGGNIYALGERTDGKKWRIGIADPENPSENAGILDVSNCAVVTSGNYERNFTLNGKTYGHIIDPKTGFPADNDLLSVTVVSEEGRLCDTLSTALFVMGKDKAADYWKAVGGFEMIMIEKSGNIFVTDGIFGDFSSERAVFCIDNAE